MGTAIVIIILVIIVGLIIKGMINDKRNGKTFCTHDCNSCGNHMSCEKIDDLKRDLEKAKKNL